jgi:protein-tyrosine-phosphatase
VVDLVVAMTRDHAGAVVARDPALRSRVFLPAEFPRLGDGLSVSGSPADHVQRVGEGRTGTVIGRPHEEIADPAGEPIDVYRATADRLDRALGDLVRSLVGAR